MAFCESTSWSMTLSRPKRWTYRLAAGLLIPLLILVVLESVLRLCHVGYVPTFFIRIPGTNAVTTNPSFANSFFPSALATSPFPCRITAKKPLGTYRIVILGSSAAAGTPSPHGAYSFGRILEILLTEAFPQTHFEVINAAMVAINSHVIYQIARDCCKYSPDLFVLYSGNNEVIGPYGPGTVFQSDMSSVPLIRAVLFAQSTRIGQCFSKLSGLLDRDSVPSRWGGMEMFTQQRIAWNDLVLHRVYNAYAKNISDLVEVVRRSGSQLIVSTVATNLQ